MERGPATILPSPTTEVKSPDLRVVPSLDPAPGPVQGQEVKPEFCDGRPLSRLEFVAALVKLGVRGAELAVAAVLARRFNAKHGWTWVSLNTLARESGYRVSSVCRALAELQGHGYLAILHRGGPHDRNACNKYSLRLADTWGAAWGTPAGASTPTDASTHERYSPPCEEGTSPHVSTVLAPIGDIPSGTPGTRGVPEGGLRSGEGVPAAPSPCSREEGEADPLFAIIEFLPCDDEPRARRAIQALLSMGKEASALVDAARAYAEHKAGVPARYLTRAENFYVGGRWESPDTWGKPGPKKAKAAAKSSDMEDYQGRPLLSVLVAEDWDPDACAECSKLSDEDRGDSCPVATCPAAALSLVDDEPRVDSARCTLCGSCWSGCPAQGFSLVARPEALPEAEKSEKYGGQLSGVRKGLGMDVPTFAEFCGLGGEKEVAILIALEGGAGWAPRAIFDTLEESAGIPLPKFEQERRERAGR